MMTPVYLNPPSSPFSLGEQAEDQRLKLFISSPYGHQAASSSYSLSFPTFFAHHSSLVEDQTLGSTCTTTTLAHDDQSQLYHHKAKGAIWHGDDQACSSSSCLVQAAHVVDIQSSKDHKLSISPCTSNHERQINGGEGGKSNYNIGNTRPRTVKWMSSKMRLVQKMANPTEKLTEHKLQIAEHQESSETSNTNNNINTAAAVRVCSDCNTNTTPLWRSGPRGPKSLCNACGIRQRKARRAMAEAAAAAANGFVVGTSDPPSDPKGKVANKEKKLLGSQSKNKSKLIITDTCISHNNSNNICFKGLAFQGVFPQDVAQAAILLMELSSGLINYSS